MSYVLSLFLPERPVFSQKTRVKISHSNPTLKQAPPISPISLPGTKVVLNYLFPSEKKNNPPPSPSVCRAGRRGGKSRRKLQKVFLRNVTRAPRFPS